MCSSRGLWGGEWAAWISASGKSTCKDGLSRVRDFPPSDCSGGQVPPRRVGALVGRRGAQPRRGGGRAARWRLLGGSGARALSPGLARPLTHRKRLQQWGHFQSLEKSPSVATVALTMSDNNTGRRQTEHQHSNSGQVVGQAIGSTWCLISLVGHVTVRGLRRPITQDAVVWMCRGLFPLGRLIMMQIKHWPPLSPL